MPPFKGPKPVIGILGGIGSGKSHVSQAFARLGCGVVDADLLARQALNSPPAIDQVRKWWGQSVIGPDGLPDRKAIAGKVFNNADELARLEGLIHPIVLANRATLVADMNLDPKVLAIIEDCPLLLEKCLEGPCDFLVFVEASEATRLARVKATRGWSHEELVRRELRQMPLDTKRKRADYVIKNEHSSGDASGLTSQASRVLEQILRSQH